MMYINRDIHVRKIKVKKSLFNSFFLSFLTDRNEIDISDREKFEHSEYVHYVIIIPRVLISSV